MTRVAWAHRLACVTAAGTVALIVAGGLVTNTGAGLAVPDWPTTFGHSLFLFPWSRMVGGVLVEHSHRLLGAAIGMLTILLAVALRLGDRRGWVRGLGMLAVVLVATQGVIGGLRVVLLEDWLALIHGCVAQLFFALLVGLAVVTGRAWQAPGLDVPAAAQLARLGILAASMVYGQVVLGAFTTHGPAVWWHVTGAVVVTGVVGSLALAVRRGAAMDPVLEWWARAMYGLLLGQLLLGLGAYVVRFTSLGVPGGQLTVVALPVLHRAVGALLFGSTVALALQLGRQRSRLAGARPAPTGVPVRTEVLA